MPPATTSKKYMSLTTAISTSINAMVGAGIFSVPLALQAEVGPAGIITYLLVIGSVWCIGLSLAQVGRIYPGVAAFYNYTAPWGGHILGMMTTCLYIVGLVIAMSLLTSVAGESIHTCVPLLPTPVAAYFLLLLLTLLSAAGLHISSMGQRILFYTTITPIIIITILCLMTGSVQHLFPFAPYGYWSIIRATRSVIFGFFGFECVTAFYPLLEHPTRDIPRALTYAILFVGMLYTLFVFSIIFAMPTSFLSAHESASLIELLTARFPQHQFLTYSVSIAIIAAVVGTIHAMLWSASTLIVSAYTKAFPQHSIRPSTTLIGLSIIIGVLCTIITDINLFFSITALCVVTAYALSITTLLLPRTRINTITRIIGGIGLCSTIIIGSCALYDIVYYMLHTMHM